MGLTPSVSVVIPAYNRADLLPRALRSAVGQTVAPLEILVVDDASQDDTAAVAERWSDRGVRLLRNARNMGGAGTRNVGIEAARGDFVAFLDSDDEWLPDKLERQLALFAARGPEVGVVYCGLFVHRDDTGLRVASREPMYRGDVFRHLATGWCPQTTTQFVVRRAALEAVGGFDPEMPSFQDYELWLRLSRHYRFDAVDDPLVVKHEHAGEQIGRAAGPRLRGLDRILEKWGGELEAALGAEGVARFRSQHVAAVHRVAVFKHLELGERRAAAQSLARFLRVRGARPGTAARLATAVVLGARPYRGLTRLWRRVRS